MNQNDIKFKDTLKLAKDFQSKQFTFNYTTLDDYFRSPLIPDNQKVLIALLVLKKRFKSLTISNSFIASFLNAKGMYEDVYKTIEGYYDLETGEYVPTHQNKVGTTIVYSKTKEINGVTITQPLYTKTAVSDAIKKWEREGILYCNYEYEFNKKMDKPYKYTTTRTISFNFDELKRVLTCFYKDSEYYSSLNKRSRKRKLIRQRPFSILDGLQDILLEMSEELKKKYKTARGIFLNFCWSFTKKFMNSSLINKPTSSFNSLESYQKNQSDELKKLMKDSALDVNINSNANVTENYDPTIREMFKQMRRSC